MFSPFVNISLVLLWAIIAWLISAHSWGKQRKRIGTTLTYVTFFAMAHWLPMIIILLPWYTPLEDAELNWLGFYQSLIAIASFAFGTIVITKLLKSFHEKRIMSPKIIQSPPSEFNQGALPLLYVTIGLLFIFVVTPALSRIPTVSAFVSGTGSLFQAGMFLLLWQGFQRKRKGQVVAAWLIIAIWPVLSVVTSGFLGYSASFIIYFAVFNATMLARPGRYIIPFLLFSYFALSFFLGYWSIRESTIRGTLWYGTEQVTTQSRANLAISLLEAFKLFDVTNPDHLSPIDARLNFNHFTGRTVRRIANGEVDYGYGETMVSAVSMIIPRAIWPSKPIVLGGDDVVRKYAGVGLLSGSLSPGNLMEFYLNFGTLGVIVGFMFLGSLIGYIDERLFILQKKEYWFDFALFLVPSFSLLLVTDSFIAIVGGAVSGFLSIYAVNVVFRTFLSGRRLK